MAGETHTENTKRAYGELIDADLAVLDRIKELFQAVVDGRAPFNLISEVVAAKLLSLIRGGLNLGLIRNIDARFFTKQMESGIGYLNDRQGPSSEVEVTFSKDVIGLVDFALRNGISFGLVANILSHDFAEIFRCGCLDKALEGGFLPKCNGYRLYDEDAVGEVIPERD
jgi:hypothetical protein